MVDFFIMHKTIKLLATSFLTKNFQLQPIKTSTFRSLLYNPPFSRHTLVAGGFNPIRVVARRTSDIPPPIPT
jgi:hypothetical protein